MKTPTLPGCLGLVVTLFFSTAHAADWPQWRGQNRDGVTAEKIVPWPAAGPKQLWKTELGTGVASMAIVGEKLYTLGNKDNSDLVYCLDAATGKELWRHSYACALDPRQFEGGPAATPCVDEGRVFTLSQQGDLFCLDAANGKVVWSKNLQKDLDGKRPGWGYAGSPLIVGKMLIVDVGAPGASTVAFNKTDGSVAWKSGDDKAGYSSPMALGADGTRTLAIFKGDALVGMNATDGREIWRHPWKTSYDVNAATPIIAGDKIFISSGYDTGCATVQISNGGAKELWRNKEMCNQINTSVLWKNFIYGIHGQAGPGGQLRCLDLQNGSLKWSQKAGGGALIIADGKIVLLNESGELILAEAAPESYKELARAQVLGGHCWVTPALANGKLYCRNNQGALVCLDVSGK